MARGCVEQKQDKILRLAMDKSRFIKQASHQFLFFLSRYKARIVVHELVSWY
jgi:hypothetical protein